MKRAQPACLEAQTSGDSDNQPCRVLNPVPPAPGPRDEPLSESEPHRTDAAVTASAAATRVMILVGPGPA